MKAERVGDEELLELFSEAMEIWVGELPDIFLGSSLEAGSPFVNCPLIPRCL